MNIKIEVAATYDFNIKINDSILDDVARNYDGNFKSWARDNYKEYFDIDDLDLELEYCSYDKDEAKKLLEKAREIIGSSDEDLSRTAIDREKLRHSIIEPFRDKTADKSALKEIEVDLDLLYKALPFTALANPKTELHYIYLDKNRIEATDTRKLVQIKNHKFSFENVFFPTYFLEPLKNGGKVFINESNQLFLHYENNYYKGIEEIYRKAVYPDVSRIIKDDIYDSDIPKIKFLDSKTKEVLVGDLEKPAYEIVFNNEKYYINDLNFLPTKKFDIEYIGTYSREPLSPLPFFFFGKDFSICIMPLWINSDDKIIEKKQEEIGVIP